MLKKRLQSLTSCSLWIKKSQDELAVALLVASVQAQELATVTAAIKTLSGESVNLQDITQRLIEDQRTFRKKMKLHRANTVTNAPCQICDRRGHSTKKCYLNPKNPNNRLNLRNGNSSNDDSSNNSERTDKKNTDPKSKNANKKKEIRAAIAMVNAATPGSYRMMLASDTTAHMTKDTRILCDTST